MFKYIKIFLSGAFLAGLFAILLGISTIYIEEPLRSILWFVAALPICLLGILEMLEILGMSSHSTTEYVFMFILEIIWCCLLIVIVKSICKYGYSIYKSRKKDDN